MSKSFYMWCKSLHNLPKFTSTTQRIQVGNSQCVGVLFIIRVIVDIHGHRFEIYTLVSENHENVDLVLGIKECLWARGSNKLKRLQVWILEQISTNISRERRNIETRWTEISKSQSSICRWNLKVSQNQNYRWKSPILLC